MIYSLNISKYLSIPIVYISLVSTCTAFDISDVADPPNAKVTYVGDVIQNGLPLQMKQFSVEQPISEVFNFYKQRWSDIGARQDNVPDFIEKVVGEWRILSKIEGHSSVVVQARIRKIGVTEGFISVSDMSEKKEVNEITTSFPRLTDSEILSSTESQDSGRIATTLMITNKYSIDENNNYYRSNMSEKGWYYTNGEIRNNVAMLHFTKENQQCEIAISERNGKTLIFSNVVQLNEDS